MQLEKKLQIWEIVTSLPLGNRVPAVFLSLTGESKEAILNLEIEKLMTM